MNAGDTPSSGFHLRQWMLRITDYADRLESELDDLDWSYGIKKLQKDWIGRSTGAEVDFFVGNAERDFEALEIGASVLDRRLSKKA